MNGLVLLLAVGGLAPAGVALAVFAHRRTRGGPRRWRATVWAAGASVALVGLAPCLTVRLLIDAFGAVAEAEADVRSRGLSEAIEGAMYATFVPVAAAVVIQLAVFALIWTRGAPR